MHYYTFNIGNYRRRTLHLEPIEHYIYRELIDWYYLDEKPIPKETQSVLRRLRLGLEYKANLENVLTDFFDDIETGYAHKHIEADICAYKAKKETNKKNGKKGGRPRKQQVTDKKTQSVNSANPNESENNPNQEPITNNQIKKTKAKKEPELDYSSWPSLPDKQILDDWLSMRKRLKANVTQTVINRFGAELHKAMAAGYTVNDCLSECVTRNWKGFKTAWLQNSEVSTNGQNTGQSKPSLAERATAARKEWEAKNPTA